MAFGATRRELTLRGWGDLNRDLPAARRRVFSEILPPAMRDVIAGLEAMV